MALNRRLALLLTAAFTLGAPAPPHLSAQDPTFESHAAPDAASSFVQYEYPEQVQLTTGRPQQVDLHFRIRDGLHINSHKPLDASFIRTELIVDEPSGIDVQAVSFPEGESYTSKGLPGEKLSVYTGELVLHARIVATKPGNRMMEAALRYQACDADRCFPPKKAPVALNLIVH